MLYRYSIDELKTMNKHIILSEYRLVIKELATMRKYDNINWYLAYSTETVTIIEPQYIKEKLVLQAQKIIKKYGGKD